VTLNQKVALRDDRCLAPSAVISLHESSPVTRIREELPY
jgi:hypothetical protein